MHREEGRPAVEVVLTVLHAGGKFGGSGYAVSGGLHGVGVSVVNALSTTLDVEIRRDGLVVARSPTSAGCPRHRLRRARPLSSPGRRSPSGPTDDIFETTDYDFETLARRFQEMAFLNKGLRLTLTTNSALATDARTPSVDRCDQRTRSASTTTPAAR